MRDKLKQLMLELESEKEELFCKMAALAIEYGYSEENAKIPAAWRKYRGASLSRESRVDMPKDAPFISLEGIFSRDQLLFFISIMSDKGEGEVL